MLGLLSLAGCASTPRPPMGFELIDQQARVHTGSLNTQTRGMTVGIGQRVYNGFYVLESESVTTMSYPPTVFVGRYGHPGFSGFPYGGVMMPMPARAVALSNKAKAHLRSAEGDHLACEFLFDGPRATGTCTGATGVSYQFVAGQ